MFCPQYGSPRWVSVLHGVMCPDFLPEFKPVPWGQRCSPTPHYTPVAGESPPLPVERVCGTILRRAWERGRPRPPRIARYRPRTRASGCRLTGGGVELRQPWAGGDARAPRGAKQCRTPRWNFSGFGRAGVIGRATRRLLDWWGTEPRSGMQVSRCSRMGAHEPEHPNA